MDNRKNLLIVLGEWWEQRRVYRPASTISSHGRLNHWLPSRGNVIFTLLVASLIVAAQVAGAFPNLVPRSAPDASSTSTISYQGRLADTSGTPVTALVNMEFRIYNAASGSAPLWEEFWTGANAVSVSDGLFNVMLGSLVPISQNVVSGNNSLWLGVTAGTDNEMTPRVQLGSVPFATQAQSLSANAVIPYVPRVLAYVNKQNDLTLNSGPTDPNSDVASISFTLPSAPPGYRWDLEWRFNARTGVIVGKSVASFFLLDGVVLKDQSGNPFTENKSLWFANDGTNVNNILYGGTVYQNNMASGSHTLTWKMSASSATAGQFLVRQRWLTLTGVLVPENF